MAQWGKSRQANNSPIWGPALLNQAPNTANRDALFQDSNAGGYHTGETIGVVGIKASELAANVVIGVDVVASGNGYTAQPNVAFSSGGGSGAAADCWAKVNAFTLNGPGTGGSYIPGENLSVADGTGTAATVNVSATELRTVTVVAAGSGYANNDVISLDTGTGTAATFTVTTGAANTGVASLALTTRGSYTANPTLVGCTTTSANTAASNGCTVTVTTRIKTIAALTYGSYSALPTLSGAGTSGSATGTGATLNLTIGVEKVVLSNTGSGYTSAPTVTFGGTGGTGTTGNAIISTGGSYAGPGWVKTTVGSGGRAGRVQNELLTVVKTLT